MKEKFPASIATAVAAAVSAALAPACGRIEIAGSLRRRKSEVGDIEIIYVPKIETRTDLLGEPDLHIPLTDRHISNLESFGILERRKNIKGNEAFGDKIKLMRHVESQIPIDLFSIPEASWWNYLVCRTGGAASNTRIAGLAKARGYKWEPYSEGFVDLHDGRRFKMESEEAVFKFVGLPYEEPSKRL